jgi:tryptophan synthase alpha chain
LLGEIKGRKLLIPFFTAGYPDLPTSLELARVATDAGADIIELGVPFSDPLADGPSIQRSSKQAIDNGVSLSGILKAVETLRRKVSAPIVLMGYTNPIIAMGLDKFFRCAAGCGVDGLIIPDMPIEEATRTIQLGEKHGISLIFLVAPTTPRERITAIDLASTDLVYAVTVTGVTGAGKRFGADTGRYFRHLRRSLSKPFVAGFGVSSPEIATRFCQTADGVVIGSALVEIIRNAPDRRSAVRGVDRFLRSVRRAI